MRVEIENARDRAHKVGCPYGAVLSRRQGGYMGVVEGDSLEDIQERYGVEIAPCLVVKTPRWNQI